jgi:DNA-binding transcriptional LysR family regulator
MLRFFFKHLAPGTTRNEQYMNLSQLQYFLRLAELQHMTQAAESLFITQSALSISVSRLEDELGVELFVRAGRTVHLTKYGREYYDFVKPGLDTLEAGKAAMQRHASKKEDRLRIGTVYSFQEEFLPFLLASFKENALGKPIVTIDQGLTSSLLDGLANDTYDFVFCTHYVDDPSIAFLPIIAQQLNVIVNKSHPYATKSVIQTAELANQRLLTYRNNTPLGASVSNLLSKDGVSVSIEIETEVDLISLLEVDPGATGLALASFVDSDNSDFISIPLAEALQDFFPVLFAYKPAKQTSRSSVVFIKVVEEFSKKNSK